MRLDDGWSVVWSAGSRSGWLRAPRRDLSKGGVALVGPGPDGGPCRTDRLLDRVFRSGPHSWQDGVAVQGHVSGGSELGGDGGGQPGGLGVEPGSEGRVAVLFEHAGDLEDDQDGIGGQLDTGETHDVGGFDRRARRALEAAEDPQPLAGAAEGADTPAVLEGVVGEVVVEEAQQLGVFGFTEAGSSPGDEVVVMVKNTPWRWVTG
jgi:hypothetical protein